MAEVLEAPTVDDQQDDGGFRPAKSAQSADSGFRAAAPAASNAVIPPPVTDQSIAEANAPMAVPSAAPEKPAGQYVVGTPKGLLTQGNINILDRPIVPNPDEGGSSTVYSMGIEADGKHILIPRVSDGKDGKPPHIMSEPEAKAYFRKTGEHLGMFDSDDAADAYGSQALHLQQSTLGNRNGRTYPQAPGPFRPAGLPAGVDLPGLPGPEPATVKGDWLTQDAIDNPPPGGIVKKAAVMAVVGPGKPAYDAALSGAKQLATGLGQLFLPTAGEERENPNSFTNQRGQYGASDVVGPKPVAMSPQEQDEAQKQVIRGLANTLAGGGKVGLVIGAPELAGLGASAAAGDTVAIAALTRIGASVGVGAGASYGAGKISDKLNLSPEAKELAQQAAFWTAAGLTGYAAKIEPTKGDFGTKGIKASIPGASADVGFRPAYRQPAPEGGYGEGSSVVPGRVTAGVTVAGRRFGTGPEVRTTAEVPPAPEPKLLEPVDGSKPVQQGPPAVPPEVTPDGRAAGEATAQHPNMAPAMEQATNAHQPVGTEEPQTGRPIVQPTDNPAINQALATSHMPEFEAGITKAIAGIPGANLAASRAEKNPERLAEKINGEGKPASTVGDYGAVQISVDSPEARDATVATIKKAYPVVVEDDKFEKGDKDYGYRNHSLQVQTPTGGTMEVQIVPKEVMEANPDEHGNYKTAREAKIAGNEAEFEKQAADAKAKNDAAMDAFNARNEGGTKYKFGSTQSNIPEDSDAHTGIEAARAKIADADLAGDGKDIDGNHVTVRYGLQGDDTAGVEKYVRSLTPFQAKLGKTSTFPPSPNSDGAAVIKADVEAPELHRINAELAKHGDFKEPDFDYHPHATVAYVKPEAAQKYVGMDDTDGKTFTVDSIAISNRNGDHKEIPLEGGKLGTTSEAKGGRGESPEQPAAGGAKALPAPAKESQGEVLPPAKSAKIEKGSAVTLSDGTAGTVAWSMGGKARVKTADGNRRDVPVKELQGAPAAETKAEGLSALRDKYAAKGVDSDISETPKEIKLSKVVVPKGERGNGIGTQFMDDLTKYADKQGKRIVLTPSDAFGGSSVSRLKGFYKRFGFAENKGGKRDFTTRESMIRPAKEHVDTEPIGKPLSKRVAQIKDLIAKGTDVRIFSARVADDPQGTARAEIEAWSEKNLGKKLPVTDAKDDNEAWILDDHANVAPNVDTPFDIPPIPKGKWLGVDLDRTIAAEGKPNAEAPQELSGVRQPEATAKGEEKPAEAAKPAVQPGGEPVAGVGTVKPGAIGEMPSADLRTDPKRFQYKLNTDASGASSKLKDVKWNPELSGILTAWTDPADGVAYVVNGHHRLERAEASGGHPVAVRMLPDTVKTAAEARIVGALQNIAEGNGTAIDAAKFLRDTGYTPAELGKYGIAMTGQVAEGGAALAKLDQKFFDDVVAGRIPERRGIAIARAADTPEAQEALVKMIGRAEAKGRTVTNATIEELGRMVKGAETVMTQTASLFGTQERTQNTALEKAEVSAYLRNQLTQEKKLFAGLSDKAKADKIGAVGENKIDAGENKAVASRAEQAQEIYDRLSTRTGPVNDILNLAAKRIAEGENANTVKTEAYRQLRTAISEALRGGPEAAGRSDERNAARPETKEVTLPGMGEDVARQAESVADVQRENNEATLTSPKGDISKAAGDMERNSPLFRDSGASGQGGLFGSEPTSQTDTPAFKKWFGDSKVVTAAGKPLVVYHGTDAAFDAFSKDKLGHATNVISALRGFFFTDSTEVARGYADHAALDAPVKRAVDKVELLEHLGKWDEAEQATIESERIDREIQEQRARGQNIIPAYLKIENPAIMDAKGGSFFGDPDTKNEVHRVIDKARRDGNDGVIIQNLDDHPGRDGDIANHYLVFEPTQIKSAIGNSGAFDPGNPDMADYVQASPAATKKAADLGSTFHSGFLDPELFKQLFPDVVDRMKEWLADEVTPGDDQRAVMRQTRGEMDRRVAVVMQKLSGQMRDWRTRPRQESIDFWNAVEGGKVASLPAKDQALANLFKGAFDKMRGEIQQLKPEALQNYIENYFPHLWDRPSAVSSTIKGMLTGKRPFAGKASFLKQRTIPTMQDGLDLGFKPKTWNPVESFMLKYAEMAQFLMGHQTLQMMKEAGTAKYVGVGQKAPDGWTQLDDRIASVYRRVKITDEDAINDATYNMRKGAGTRTVPAVAVDDIPLRDATVLAGHYYAPADAAKVFNNFVSRGLAGRSGVYDVLNWMNQNLNALQLGISAFHAATTSINAATSDVALGIQQLSEGKPLQAGVSLAKGAAVAPSIIKTMVNGSRLMREYLTPGSYAKMSAEANALALSGARIKQNNIEIKPLNRTINAWRNGAIREGLTSLPAAILDATTRPVMEFYVPRMKVGAFYAMAHNILDNAQTHNWPKDKVRAKMQEAWNSIDDRFGQMVYDNLFWPKALRDSLQLATRSVGWNFGDVRQIGGGILDTIRAAGKAAQGEVPEVTPRMAFAYALPIVSALIGGVLTYLWTGEKPQTWKDYFYPRTADGTRHSIPGYMKDVFAFAHAPVQTTENKMGPLWSMTADAINNRDFYGTEIRHKDDSPMKQVGEFSAWAAKQALPFSMTGSGKLLEQHGAEPTLMGMLRAAAQHPGDLALGQTGFSQAPAFIQNSAALNAAREYGRDNRPPGTKTEAQTDHLNAFSAVVKMYRTGHVDHDQIERYRKEGLLPGSSVQRAALEARFPPIVMATRSLSVEQALNVYEKGTDLEKASLRPVIAKKFKDIRDIADPEKKEEVEAAYHKAMSEGQSQLAAQ